MECIKFASDVSFACVYHLPHANVCPSFYCRLQAGLGTWRHSAVLSSSDVLAVPKSVPLAVAATLTSGASTALRLLNDFCSLSSGDVVVQSGGESAVGEAVVQLAAKRGVKTVTFVKVRTGALCAAGGGGIFFAWNCSAAGRLSERRGGCCCAELRGGRLFEARPLSCHTYYVVETRCLPSSCTCDLDHICAALTRDCRSHIFLVWSPYVVSCFPPFG